MGMLYITKTAPGEVGLSTVPDSPDSRFVIGTEGLGALLNCIRTGLEPPRTGVVRSATVADVSGVDPKTTEFSVYWSGNGLTLVEKAGDREETFVHQVPASNARVLYHALVSACAAVARPKGA